MAWLWQVALGAGVPGPMPPITPSCAGSGATGHGQVMVMMCGLVVGPCTSQSWLVLLVVLSSGLCFGVTWSEEVVILRSFTRLDHPAQR